MVQFRGTTRTDISEQEIFALTTAPTSPVVRTVEDISRRILNRARALCPVDEGTLRASLFMDVQVSGSVVRGVVGTNLAYALYVMQGTGVFGPSGRRIRPRRARALHWVSGGQDFFAAYVRGQRPQPFLVQAFHEVVGSS